MAGLARTEIMNALFAGGRGVGDKNQIGSCRQRLPLNYMVEVSGLVFDRREG